MAPAPYLWKLELVKLEPSNLVHGTKFGTNLTLVIPISRMTKYPQKWSGQGAGADFFKFW